MLSDAIQHGLFPFLSLQPSSPALSKHKCNLCGLECDNSVDYEHHLNSHFDHRCPYCDYTSKTEGRLKRHVKDLHETSEGPSSNGGQNSESDDSSQLNQSGQQKPRISKCKQCGFVAETKTEFWEHSKTHIKHGKMLECPQCPFVTEYKHHLEYHLRNHFGSKPFKCSKCNYSCVNKSMLNSHMKSHSNVYQYRCEDCNYATKYCHSLKLHLRKYNHKPAVVLNPDGTPNPYPIIDVYGTRRGPRPKKHSPIPGQTLPFLQTPLADVAGFLKTSSSDWMNFPFSSWPALDPEKTFPDFTQISSDLLASQTQISELSSVTTLHTPPGKKDDGPLDLQVQSSPPSEATPSPDHSEADEEQIKSEPIDWEDAPLDLSRSSPHVPQSPSSPSTPSSSSNRRKGRAYKLDTFQCDFCDMLFKDADMFSIHMNYHGFEDPFRCNVCGHQAANRLDFFVHLTRDPHK